MADTVRFTRVQFHRFKAFESFRLDLHPFNVLVGPNNSGKSTILMAFRILAAGLRLANRRKPKLLDGPDGPAKAYQVDLSALSVAEENLFFNYDDSQPATVSFHLSNGNTLLLYLPAPGVARLFPMAQNLSIHTPTQFRSAFNCPIGFVPILGPVEQHEVLYERETARRALLNYRAARHFRNIWYHFPDDFEDFRKMLLRTWPDMDVEPPRINYHTETTTLTMFCPENRIPRELAWAGFGFQVWCQMLTHIVRAKSCSVFLIDEPDIYLHSDLQRQLLAILRTLGPDILIATHSIEIIADAETDEIVLVNKTARRAKRIQRPSALPNVFDALGSLMNPVLTQLARTRRVLFLEGKDFRILQAFARKLNETAMVLHSTFAVIPVGGFNPERIRSIRTGIEATLGAEVRVAAIFDRDYRSDKELRFLVRKCRGFCEYVAVHTCKEVENFALVPEAIDRAVARRIKARIQRGETMATYKPSARLWLEEFASSKAAYIASQYVDYRRRFERSQGSGDHDASIGEAALQEVTPHLAGIGASWKYLPGKEALSYINCKLQEEYGVSITVPTVIDVMRVDEIPKEIKTLVAKIAEWASAPYQ